MSHPNPTPARAGPIDVIVLVGGRGTRLAGVIPGLLPKPLAPIADRPFLDHLLAMIALDGVARRVVLAAGYLADAIEDYCRTNLVAQPVSVVAEREPLGTAGAVRNALDRVSGPDVLVLNGDAIARWPLGRLVQAHRAGGAAATLIGLNVPDVGRYGQLAVKDGFVSAFVEKGVAHGQGLINGGVYCFEISEIARWPPGPLALERDVLPPLAAASRLAVIEHAGPFIDIGTPESYRESQQVVHAISGL